MPDMILRLVLAALLGGGQIAAPAQAIRGFSTWYDAPSSHDAAAGPALRKALGKGWRGDRVTVCLEASADSDVAQSVERPFMGEVAGAEPAVGVQAGASCVSVRLTDWCLCSKGHRVIDLDDRAFRELAPLSRGVVPVTVSWGAEIPLPATDTEDGYRP